MLVEKLLVFSFLGSGVFALPQQHARQEGIPYSLVSRQTTTYTVVSGDTGNEIAAEFGIGFDSLSTANPDLDWYNLQIGQTLQIPSPTEQTTSTSGAGGFYDVSTAIDSSATSTPYPAYTTDTSSIPTPSPIYTSSTIPPSHSAPASPNAVPSIDDNDGPTTPSPNPYVYTTFSGDGTTSSSWPDSSAWLSFSTLWSLNLPYLGTSCSFSSGSATPNTPDETGQIYSAIESIAAQSQLDHRFILAILLQESSGCVRVPTTDPAGGYPNPGLLQSADGTGSCNDATLTGGAQLTPCPATEISQMISDGVYGTPAYPSDGLMQALAQATSTDGAMGAQAYYIAARLYNSGSGSLASSRRRGLDLSSPQDAATQCYASDIANRLVGWVGVNGNQGSCGLF